MSIQRIDNAELIEIGLIKKSKAWTNVYLKFKHNNEELWLYYSEHDNKPQRLKQIPLIEKGEIKVGTIMNITYEIYQSRNRSTTLRIKDLSNYTTMVDF